jgi:NDP-sugar pyrophosphorylase family protein
VIGLILCAGLGTRLKEETKNKPKCMVEVGGKPVLERITDHMNKHGVWRIVVNLHAFPEVVMKHFGQRFLYLYEPTPMGEFATTNLVRSMFPDEVLVVMNGDTITDIDLGKYIPYYPVDPMQNTRFISNQTKRHMGTSIYTKGPIDRTVNRFIDCEYYDIGTPKKLEIARNKFK